MATSGKYVYVAWLNNSCADCKSDVLFRASSDNGTTFGPITKLNTTPNGDAENQQIAVVGSNVYVAWDNNVSATEKDIFFRASSNNGATFNNAINLCSSTSCGSISGVTSSYVPQIGASGNNVTVVWFSDSTSHNSPNPILAKTSSTNGSNLGSVAAISLSGKAYSQTPSLAPPQISEVGKYVYVTWSDVRNGPAQTFFAASNNGGSNFNFVPPVSISSAPTGETDSYLAIAATGNSVYVAWTNDTSATDNTMFRASTNNGVSFGSLTPLYKGQFTDLNPQIAATGKNVYVVWSNATVSGPQILYRVSSNNGGSFTPVAVLTSSPAAPPQQAIQASGVNVYVAWAGNSPMDSSMFASNDTATSFGPAQDLSPTTGSTTLPTPVIAVSGSNVYVAWQDDTQGNGDILFRGNGAPPGVPDVAIAAVNVSRTFAYSGVAAMNLTISVTTMNLGNVAATFTVGSNATNVVTRTNTTIGNKQPVVNLSPGASQVLRFSWNTASLSAGNYSITAYASTVAGETNISDNIKSCPSSGTGCGWTGMFTSRFKGDVNIAGSGKCLVDIVDLTGVGSTFGKSIGQLGYSSAADLNNDGIIDVSDLVVVASNFGQFLTPCPY